MFDNGNLVSIEYENDDTSNIKDARMRVIFRTYDTYYSLLVCILKAKVSQSYISKYKNFYIK